MKKILAFASSLLFLTGLKAQTPTPIVKKETQKPTTQPEVIIKPTSTIKAGPAYKGEPLPTKIGHEGIKKVTSSHIKSPAIKF